MLGSADPTACYDVVVIGGGPAGATLATFLQRKGHRCLVLERSRFPRYHVGESLVPHAYDTLERLGLIPELKRSSFPIKQSVRFVSPSGKEAEPFYFSEVLSEERAQTWQVERSVFDRMCLDNAARSGVQVLNTTTCRKVIFDHDRAVGVVAIAPDGNDFEIRSRVVADASGRATLLGSQLRLKERVPGLQKASLWSYFRGAERLSGIDSGETTVFLRPDRSWFWYIPLPDDLVSVGIVSDTDWLITEKYRLEDLFLREIEHCLPLRRRVRNASKAEKVFALRELAYRNRRSTGDGWLLLGDAASFLDPIYSSGLLTALKSAELAAESVHEALESGDLSASKLGAFSPVVARGVDVVRHLIHAFYDPEFDFRRFVDRFPEQRGTLIDCLVGDVFDKDRSAFLGDLATMTAPPPPLS